MNTGTIKDIQAKLKNINGAIWAQETTIQLLDAGIFAGANAEAIVKTKQYHASVLQNAVAQRSGLTSNMEAELNASEKKPAAPRKQFSVKKVQPQVVKGKTHGPSVSAARA